MTTSVVCLDGRKRSNRGKSQNSVKRRRRWVTTATAAKEEEEEARLGAREREEEEEERPQRGAPEDQRRHTTIEARPEKGGGKKNPISHTRFSFFSRLCRFPPDRSPVAIASDSSSGPSVHRLERPPSAE